MLRVRALLEERGMILGSFATLPHALISDGNKAADRQRGRTTLLGVGWFLPALPEVWRNKRIDDEFGV